MEVPVRERSWVLPLYHSYPRSTANSKCHAAPILLAHPFPRPRTIPFTPSQAGLEAADTDGVGSSPDWPKAHTIGGAGRKRVVDPSSDLVELSRGARMEENLLQLTNTAQNTHILGIWGGIGVKGWLSTGWLVLPARISPFDQKNINLRISMPCSRAGTRRLVASWEKTDLGESITK